MANKKDAELRKRITDRVTEEMTPKKFTPFPVPRTAEDMPLVQHAGFDYVCSGCGTHIPDGVWIHEIIKDDQVVGLRIVNGPEGILIHECGQIEESD